MWVIEDIRRTAAGLLALTGFMVVALGGLVWAPVAEHDGFDVMRQALLAEQTNEGPFRGTLAPYVTQVEVARGHLAHNEAAAVYLAMNRLMDMLEHRENEISPEVADRVFDYCSLVTPAKYHEVPWHLDRFIEHQDGEPIG